MSDAEAALDERGLAERAGVDVETIRRYTQLGLLAHDDGTYAAGDLARVRLLGSCERGGLPLDGIATAVQRELLSLSFLDMPQYLRFGSYSDVTYGEAARDAGVPFEFIRRVHEALGLGAPASEDERIHEDDLLVMRVLAVTRSFGIGEEAVLRTVRVYADALRRITDSEAQFYRSHIEQPLIASGMSHAQAIPATRH